MENDDKIHQKHKISWLPKGTPSSEILKFFVLASGLK